ncbi:hypothetical protein [Pedobacter nototheniae]|uniref:hypothetical protein n=1 Tax=Pedobacter nototheniae TaxID=2488994 RepID=UPI002930A38D|nr:hypothetical protein [Pedobacter nototheniae]
MADTYTKQVFDYYQKRKEEDSLSIHLAEPTPGNLRDECLIVYEEKGMIKDTPALRSFFGTVDQAEDYIQKIRKFDIDKFRPLVNFLVGATGNTKDKNLKLIAWLIDFESRDRMPVDKPEKLKLTNEDAPLKPPLVMPTHSTGSDADNKGGQSIIEEEIPRGETIDADDVGSETSGGGGVSNSENGGQESALNTLIPGGINEQVGNIPVSIPKFIIACGFVVISFVGICIIQFWGDQTKRSINPILASQKCMYWAGNHYEQMECDQKGIVVSKIPLNKQVFDNFEKIMIPDTLTSNSLGKVWYSKQNNKVDFYTDSAAHPTDDNRRLLPLTQYMLDKYVSYKRYMLNIIYWSAGLTVFILLFGGGAIYTGITIRKRKQNRAKAIN